MNDILKSRWVGVNIKKIEASHDNFFDKTFLAKQNCSRATPSIGTRSIQLTFFLNWKLISRLRFEDLVDTKDNRASCHVKRKFSDGLQPMKELKGINFLNAKRTIWKKINVSVFAHFCLCKL